MKFPLTDFICAMLPMPVDKLTRADPAKLAAKYAIDPTHAAALLNGGRRTMGSFDCVRCWKEARDRGEVGSFTRVMQLCPACGNKRCPKASDHRLNCTGSNEPDQPGSTYAAHPTAREGE